MTNHKKRTAITLFYGYMYLSLILAEAFFGFGFTAFMYARGLSVAHIGILFGIGDFAMMFFDYPSGNIADKYGRKRITGLGFLVYGAGFMLFGLANGFLLFMVSGLVRSLGAALISGGPVSWYIGELNKMDEYTYKDQSLPRVRGVARFIGAGAGIVAAALAETSITLPYFTAAAVMVGSGIMVLMLFEDNYGKSDHPIFKQLRHNTVAFLQDKSMRVLLIVKLFEMVLFTVFIILWQVFATEVVGFTYSNLGYFYTGMLLIMGFASFATGHLLKHYNGPTVTAIGALFKIVGVGVFILVPSKIGFIVGFVLIESGFGITTASSSTWVHDYIPEKVRSSYISALSAISACGAALMGFVVGPLVDAWGFTAGWMLAIGAQLITLFFLLQMRHHKRVVE